MPQHANASQEELNKFNALAQSWWDPEGSSKPLHALNPLRLNFIQESCKLSGKKVLDMGCGGGILSESLAKAGAHTTAIDLAEDVLGVAKQHAFESELNIDYRLISAEALAEQMPQQFDVITCMEMLEHVPDPASIVAACQKLLKPGGRLFLSTLNRNPKAFMLAIIGAEYVLGMLPKGTHEYAKFIKPAELSHMLRDQQFTVEDICGMTYNPFNKQFKLSRDCDVNYLVSAVVNT